MHKQMKAATKPSLYYTTPLAAAALDAPLTGTPLLLTGTPLLLTGTLQLLTGTLQLLTGTTLSLIYLLVSEFFGPQ